MTKKKIKHTQTLEIVCPYCGYVFRDSYEVDRDAGMFDCRNEKCQKEFNYERHYYITYSTTKKGESNEN
jgi:sarcosine oxidase delta subunit